MVTVCKPGVVPLGQLVPSNRQTVLLLIRVLAGSEAPVRTERYVEVALVEVTFVNTPVFGVVAPMAVLLMVPPLIVRASVTMPSVMELFGREMAPVTARFVLVVLVPVAFVQVSPEKAGAFATIRFVNRPVVAKKSVLVALVDVTVVKIAVLGEVAPIAVLLMVPPEMVRASAT